MTALAMLIAGDVNTVDTFTGVVHPFTLIPIFAPIADSQTRILIYGSQQLESETMATVVNPVSLEVTAVRGYVGSMSMGLVKQEVSYIRAEGVWTEARHQ